MGASEIPPLQFTPTEEIQGRVATLRKTFFEHKTRDIEFRLVQLRKLYWAYVPLFLFPSSYTFCRPKTTNRWCHPVYSIKDREQQIADALAADLNRPQFETVMAESGLLENDIVFVSRNLHKWAKDEKADDIDLTWKFMNPKIRKDPLGVVLVIGSVSPLLPHARCAE